MEIRACPLSLPVNRSFKIYAIKIEEQDGLTYIKSCIVRQVVIF